MILGGWPDGLYNPIYADSDASLNNQTAFCVGYGNNTLAVASPPQAQTGAGTLRTANLTFAYSSASPNVLTIAPNTTGQIATAGDSGSTCFVGGRVTGVYSTCAGNGVDANGNGLITCSELTSVTSGTYASPGSHRAWTEARLFNHVTARPFVFSPPLPSTAVTATLRSIAGLNRTYDAKASLTIFSGALMSGWLRLHVENEPPRTLCSIVRATASATGWSDVRGGVCLGDGVMANLYSTVL
jgi:hypothetical protein